MSEHVYFIAADAVQRVKIGIATDVARRFRTLRIASPVPLRLLGVVRNGGRELEKHLHRRFHSHRVRGEWFILSDEILSYIESNAVQGVELCEEENAGRELLSEPISFRLRQTRREMLEAFMRADGHDTLTPILREACDYYIWARLRGGRESVRVEGLQLAPAESA